jgi:hypothetical protein
MLESNASPFTPSLRLKTAINDISDCDESITISIMLGTKLLLTPIGVFRNSGDEIEKRQWASSATAEGEKKRLQMLLGKLFVTEIRNRKQI